MVCFSTMTLSPRKSAAFITAHADHVKVMEENIPKLAKRVRFRFVWYRSSSCPLFFSFSKTWMPTLSVLPGTPTQCIQRPREPALFNGRCYWFLCSFTRLHITDESSISVSVQSSCNTCSKIEKKVPATGQTTDQNNDQFFKTKLTCLCELTTVRK